MPPKKTGSAQRPAQKAKGPVRSAATKKSATKDAPRLVVPTKAGGRSGTNRRITIKNVAEAAGVSIATVSFVLNKRPGQVISEPVQKRVLAAARELNYAPSASAAGLARKQTSNVAIAFYRNDHQITNQLYSFVVQGAIKEAAERHYNVLFSFIHDEFRDYDDLPKIIREKNAEGVLFVQDVSGQLYKELTQRGVNVVAVDSHPEVPGMETVYVDNASGGRIAARHLLDLGHEDIVFLTAAGDRPSISQRSGAFLEEIRAAGLKTSTRQLLVDAKRLTFDGAYARTKKLLAQRPSVTAIAAANDELAAGVIRAAHEAGRRVPEDLSVMGFDDIIMTQYLDPPLTSIGYDKEEMGRVSMGRLIDQVSARDSQDGEGLVIPPRGERTELPVWLVARQSTGPAPGKKKRKLGA